MTFSACLPSLTATTVTVPDAPASMVSTAVCAPVDATATLTTDKAVKLFEKFGIFTKAELESREEIIYETYAKTINIEALTMIDMAGKQIIPAVVKYTKTLADTANAIKAAGGDASVQTELLADVSTKLAAMQKELNKLVADEKEASAMEDVKAQAFLSLIHI